ncbi:hypothetical protein A3F08_01090 [Candidatus Berkelbacteria bacterium RIFCSPHIGHO2_12_FULL_36_9]|uniref:General secretion pathway GspH domain-containing protein n=1 Tax=Candidatus Berkelbacteria bacterium RIFCSPHIGHO2_12_FULL_36_9 TaxID=1797469 RepID=A0A1F5EE97_9BACT|nr:MAG: hypothetical protein A3F08_01090 [Candidatus Berkelbacteria bacterium RIFCSPHIGHO2_12_FULL_36_9]
MLLLFVAIPSFNNYGRYNELQQMAETIKSDILETKNYALSPPQDRKIVGGEVYKIVFFAASSSDPGKYKIFEEGNSEPILDGGIGPDYPLEIINPSSVDSKLEIKFSIPQAGKIIEPINVSNNTINVRIKSNRISDQSKNFIDILVDTVTGKVELKPSWQSL